MQILNPDRINNYTLLHIADHLHAANQHERLHQLLTRNPGWMTLKFDRLGSDSSFLADVKLAMARYTTVAPDDLVAFAQLQALQQLIRYRSHSRTDADLKLMVWSGHQERAINHARMRFDPYNRFTSLAEIYQTLIDADKSAVFLRDELEEAARRISATSRHIEALIKLRAIFHDEGYLVPLARLQHDIEQGLLQLNVRDNKDELVALYAMSQALYGDTETAGQCLGQLSEMFWKIEVMVAIGVAYGQSGDLLQATGYFDDAWKAAEDIDDIFIRFGVCCDLIVNQHPYTQTSLHLMKELLDEALAIEAAGIRISMLSLLASTFARIKEFDRAIQILDVIRHRPTHSQTLKDIVIALVQDNRLRRARELAQNIAVPDIRAQTLRDIALIQAEKGNLEAAHNFQQQALQILDVSDASVIRIRVEACCTVATLLSRQNLPDAASQLMTNAIQVVQQIEMIHQNARICYAVIVETLVKIDNYQQALSIANNPPQDSWQDELRCSLVKGLTARNRLPDAENIYAQLRYPDNRVAACCHIARAYAQNAQMDSAKKWLREALAAEDVITQNRAIFHQLSQEGKLAGLPENLSTKLVSARGDIIITLCQMSRQVTPTQSLQWMQQAAELMRDKSYITYSARGLPHLIRTLVQQDKPDRAAKAITQYQHRIRHLSDDNRDIANNALAKAFSELNQYEEALAVIQTIQNKHMRLDVIQHIVKHLLHHHQIKRAFELLSDTGIDHFLQSIARACINAEENQADDNTRLMPAILKIISQERDDWQINAG